MAGIVPAGGGVGASRFRRRRYVPIADINVTPLVDVMLVLLIIFMITAPLLQVGVPVDLPKTSAQQVGGKDEPLVVSVNSQGEVFLGETKYDLPDGSKRYIHGFVTEFSQGSHVQPWRSFHDIPHVVTTTALALGCWKHDQIVHHTGSGPGGHNIFDPKRARRHHSYLLVFAKGES